MKTAELNALRTDMPHARGGNDDHSVRLLIPAGQLIGCEVRRDGSWLNFGEQQKRASGGTLLISSHRCDSQQRSFLRVLSDTPFGSAEAPIWRRSHDALPRQALGSSHKGGMKRVDGQKARGLADGRQ
jgi:hypothetical protein